MAASLTALRLSSRDRRALRLGLVLAVPTLIYVFAIKPYVASIRVAKDSLQTQRDLLAREEALVRNAPNMPRQIAAARSAVAAEHMRLYSQPDVIAATGALSREVSAAFEDAGISLQHVETHDVVVRPNGVRELTVDIRAEGDFEGILDVLATFETSDHLIRVSRLGIERGQVMPVANVPATSVSATGLAIVATIHGYAP
jgi:hypothetical protein